MRGLFAVAGRLLAGSVLLLLLTPALPGCGPEPPAARGHKRILVLGDSLTEGAGLPSEKVFPAVMERAIRAKGYPDVVVVADGVGGAISQSGPVRLQARVEGKFDILVLELGANDGLRGLDLDALERNLSRSIELAQADGMKVVLAGMRVPPHHGFPYKKRFDGMYRTLAKRYGTVLVPFLLSGVAARPSLNLPDGLHPNERGQERLAQNLLKAIEPHL